MTQLRLTLAMGDYDHVRDLTLGRVRARGIDTTVLNMAVEEIFFRCLHFREFHASELSLGKYASLRSQGDQSLTAIPVFPSRMFRQSSIYVRTDSSATSPLDLAGGRIGIPEWAQTASIYTRGLLAHDFGLELAGFEWYQAGVNEPGRKEKVKLRLPEGIRYTAVPDRSLDEMLLADDLDAVLSAHPPEHYGSDGPIRRLFADAPAVELDYWLRTGVFPIMHVVVLRDDVLAANPWVARELLLALEEAKDRSVARARDLTAPHAPVPWIADHAAAAVSRFGDDYWPYGLEPNRTTLEAFLGFAYEQGVLHQPLEPEDLFAEGTLDGHRI